MVATVVKNFQSSMEINPIPVAERFIVRICGYSLAVIVGSNPPRCMDICFLCVLCVIGRGLCVRLVLPKVVCPMSAIAKLRKGRP